MRDHNKKPTSYSNSELFANKPTRPQHVDKVKSFPVVKIVTMVSILLVVLLVGLISLAFYVGGLIDEKKRANLVEYMKCEAPSAKSQTKKYETSLVTNKAKVTIHKVAYNVPSDNDYVSGYKNQPSFGCKKGVFVQVSITANERFLNVYDFDRALRVADQPAKQNSYDYDTFSNTHNLRILSTQRLTPGQETTGWLTYEVDLASDNKRLTFDVPGTSEKNQQKSVDISLE